MDEKISAKIAEATKDFSEEEAQAFMAGLAQALEQHMPTMQQLEEKIPNLASIILEALINTTNSPEFKALFTSERFAGNSIIWIQEQIVTGFSEAITIYQGRQSLQ